VRWYQLPKADNGAYGRLLRALWARGETFVICEHDVIPTRAQLDLITSCGHDWCSFAYDDGLYPRGPMFGLVRFDSRVMAEHPYAAEVATEGGERRPTEVPWWDVDNHVARDLKIRQVEWFEHSPPVHHHHLGPPSGPMV